MMEKKSNWGGARKGAGRKPIVREGVQMTITLTPENREKLKALGGSRWVAAMIEREESIRAEKGSRKTPPKPKSPPPNPSTGKRYEFLN